MSHRLALGLLAVLLLPGALAAPARAVPRGQATGRELQATAERLEQLVKEHPDDAESLTRLGQVLAQLGRRAEAQEAYRRAIAILPTSFAAYSRLADLLAEDPRRWEQRQATLTLLRAGLAHTVEGSPEYLRLSLSVANFERAVGQTQAARARLQALEAGKLPAALRKRVLDLLEAIQSDEQEGALRDWPEPRIAPALSAELAAAEQAFRGGAPQTALAGSERLIATAPGWWAPHWLRGRALEALGRFDEAERELTILLQLLPSHAEAWRLLGMLLAVHGGALDAERSDEALRHALSLEPGYFDLWLLRAKVALRRGAVAAARRALERYLREAAAQASAELQNPEVQRLLDAVKAQPEPSQRPSQTQRGMAPSPKAQELFRQATDWLQSGDPVGLAPDLLAAALADSPGYVDAAATAYAISGQVPAATVAALWQDGEALLSLSRQIRAISSSAETRRLLRPWLDRAILLGTSAAYFERGALLVEDNDLGAGLDDLRAYVASLAKPPALGEARVLLAAIDSRGATDAALLRARSRLFAEKPQEAAAALGGLCDDKKLDDRAAFDKLGAKRIVMLGIVHEWTGELAQAVACYRLALRRAEKGAGAREPLERLSGVAGRMPLRLCAELEPELWRAQSLGVPSSHFALARLLLSRGETESALSHLERFLAVAPPQDPSRPAALAERARILEARELLRRKLLLHRLMFGAAALALAGSVLVWLLRGRSLGRALVHRPALFPEVARTIGELRHDVLKHRTSALGLVAADPGLHEQVQRMLWEPERASSLIATAYARLQAAARAHGVLLRPLGREPIFGPLLRDLRRAESLLKAPALSPKALAALGRVDERLRALHFERLGSLLRMGPRTPVGAALITAWIREVEAELRLRGEPWTSPVLLLEGLELGFPVERLALMTLFTNLLRNAQAAVASESVGPPSVLVRIGEERDATGRRVLILLVGDSAKSELTLESIERRESGRGLAILRDLVHEWRGHLIVRPESAPLRKGVGACFPA